MTLTLVRKLLRDVRLYLAGAALLLGAFQVLWARVVARILGELAPFFNNLAAAGGVTKEDVQSVVFGGPGKVVRTLIGGEQLDFDRAMDLLSVGYVHPVVQVTLCVWAVGRAAGAVAGEIDRGTMELLLAQPLARGRLILAHLCVDLVTIPLLCLSLWAGNFLGAWLVSPIEVKPGPAVSLPGKSYLLELGPLHVRLAGPGEGRPPPDEEREARLRERLRVAPAEFGPALGCVGGLAFALSGVTMALSAAGRFRGRVLGLAVSVTLVQFLANVVGQLYEPLEWLRPLTLFYYYQPQQAILGGAPDATLLLVLYGAGAAGYAVALAVFTRRDLPAPL
jgi:ABC-2 type transport system permease protein